MVYIINEAGLSVNPDKIAAIINYPSPTSAREVRRLLDLYQILALSADPDYRSFKEKS